MNSTHQLIEELRLTHKETEWLEFKHNNKDPDMIGKSISALANGAAVADKSKAYLVWGIDDKTHNVIGTDVRIKDLKKGNEEIENWLRHQLSENAHFEIHDLDIDEKHVEFLTISKAVVSPVVFEKNAYIRVGSYTKDIKDYPSLHSRLWHKLQAENFEDAYACTDVQVKDIRVLLDCEAYFSGIGLPSPSTEEEYARSLTKEELIIRQDNGLYAITNLGALLFARKLSEFKRIERKAIRVIQYDGHNRNTILKDETEMRGYAIAFEPIVMFINTLLPTQENLEIVQRTIESKFPLLAIREAIANSLIHQDFCEKGAGPLVELFSNKVEVTNPGVPLVESQRIVDTPPKSRNEKIASLMRRLRLCEELGRGWDRMVSSCEQKNLPAPTIQLYESPSATRVSLFAYREFSTISMEDKLWATYLHSTIKYLENDALTNSSLRQRFGLNPTSAGSISRLINEAVSKNLIKPVDPNTAKRYMKYIPIWG